MPGVGTNKLISLWCLHCRMGRSPSQQGHRHGRARCVPELFRRGRRNQLAAASCSREGFTKLSRFSLTKVGIQLFCVFRDKRASCTQAAGVLPGLRVEPTLVRLMTKVGLCRVPERTVIFDSLVLDLPTRTSASAIRPRRDIRRADSKCGRAKSAKIELCVTCRFSLN